MNETRPLPSGAFQVCGSVSTMPAIVGDLEFSAFLEGARNWEFGHLVCNSSS
jgi:hypothetical protein